MKWILPFFFLLILIGTSCRPLSVDRRYTNSGSLASNFVKSPDPLKENPPLGEKLWVSWKLPSKYFRNNDKYILNLRVVKKNLEEDVVTFPVTHRIGRVVYSCMGEQYSESGGVLTYKAEIVTLDGVVIKTVKQSMWFTPIHVDE
ncbi:MAG: hypothetical protein P0S95_02890 [Rhabdochlamydiaceae bacterium]|nr:hypothetical protein [Candidatus Amphrikana amoebophyrae]